MTKIKSVVETMLKVRITIDGVYNAISSEAGEMKKNAN